MQANDPSQKKIDHKSVNEKKKWQIALRRYVINKNKSVFYAPYFGIDIEGFRSWVEVQFDSSLSWDNFSKEWQFEHVLPVSFFNNEEESDLRLCWNFLNIKIERLNATVHKTTRLDLQSLQYYFEEIYKQTRIETCRLFIERIASAQIQKLLPLPSQVEFLKARFKDITALQSFTAYEFERLNSGDNIENLLAEQALMKRFS